MYLHNETGVLGPAAKEVFGIEVDTQSSGMICFTDLSHGDTDAHQLKFGRFGVGISKDWLIEQGARRVSYVEIGGTAYNGLVGKMKELAPETLWGTPTNEYLNDRNQRFIAAQALTVRQWALNAGIAPEYVSFLEDLICIDLSMSYE